MKYHIFIDFDGTITQQDSLVYLLDKHTGKTWRKIEDQVTANLLDEKEALQYEFDYLEISLETAMADLKNFPIDPHFKEFVKFCEAKDYGITIVSGGIDKFIGAILSDHNLSQLEYHSNSISVNKNKWKVIESASPKIQNKCNHCKTYRLMEAKINYIKTIYIGDGNTDRCPAEKADIRFAKDDLADYFDKKDVQYIKYQNFSDVLSNLKTLR